jgi:hypothetical protein
MEKVGAGFALTPAARLPAPTNRKSIAGMQLANASERDLAQLRATSLSIRTLLEEAQRKARAVSSEANQSEVTRLRALDQQLREEMAQLRPPAASSPASDAGTSAK